MIEIKFSDLTKDFDVKFSQTKQSFNVFMIETSKGLVLDHTRLENRSMSDSHPIEAITGLSSELKTFPNESMTNIELEALLI